MGCGYLSWCIVMIVTNSFYLAIGLAFFISGIIMAAGKDLIGGSLAPMVQPALQDLQTNALIQVNAKDIIADLMKYFAPVAVGFIFIGIILIFLSVYGMCAICFRSRILVIVYITITSAVIFIQFVVILVFATNKSKLQDSLNSALQEMIGKYAGFFDTSTESFIINVLNIMYNCCGAQGSSDFRSATNFNRNLTGVFTYAGQSKLYTTTLFYPISCCQFNNFQFVNMDGCLRNQSFNNRDIGCASSIFDKMNPYFVTIYKIAGGLIAFQILVLASAVVCLVYLIYKKRKQIKPL